MSFYFLSKSPDIFNKSVKAYSSVVFFDAVNLQY